MRNKGKLETFLNSPDLCFLREFLSRRRSSVYRHAVRCRAPNFFYTSGCEGDLTSQFGLKYFSPLLDLAFHGTPFFASVRLISVLSLNGLVLIDLDNSVVIKIVQKNFEPEFYKLEILANEFFPQITPRIFERYTTTSYFIVKSQFIPRKRFVPWSEWHPYFKLIYRHQFENCRVRFVPAVEYLDKLRMSLLLTEKGDLLGFLPSGLIKTSLRMLELYRGNASVIPVLHVHGDLTPNNLILSDTGYYLIDFGNGGEHVFVFDLMIQEFYRSHKSSVWRQFPVFDFLKDSKNGVFWGTNVDFFSHFASISRYSPENVEIRLFFILALCELLIKNVSRYQSGDDNHGGKDIIRKIALVFSEIFQASRAQALIE